jgi:PAS domain S-box-containing protein
MGPNEGQAASPDAQLFYDAFNASPIGIALENLEGRPLFVNPALCSMLGFSAQEICSKSCVDFSPPEDAEKDWALFEQLRAGRIDRYQIDKRFLRRDGSLMWGRLSISLLNDRKSPMVLAMVEDITEKRKAEEELLAAQEAERQRADRERHLLETLELVTRHMTVAVSRCSRDLRFLWVNQFLAELLQRPLGEIAGRPMLDLLGHEAIETLRPHFERVLRGDKVHYEEEVNYQGLGRRWVSATYTPTLDADGVVNGWVAVVVDITDRKQAELGLRESEERLRLAAQAGKMYAYEWNATTDLVVRSGPFALIVGETGDFTRQQLLLKVHPDDRALFAASCTECTPANPDTQISYRLFRPDGSVVWLEKTDHAFFDEQGRMVRMVGMVADITERKQRENAIRESEKRYRRIIETTNEGVWLLDSTLRNSYVNRQLAEMLGYQQEEMVGRSVFDFYFPDYVERKKEVLSRRQQGLREQIEERLRRRDGSELWVRIAATPVFKDNGEFDGALAMVTDITERRLVEEKLRESEERFRLVANAAPVMIWMSGSDKLCTYFNQGWLEFTGRSHEAEMGNGWAEGVHPQDLERCLDIYTQAFDKRESFQMEYRLRRHDGEYRWILDSGVPRFDAGGSFSGYIGSAIDVTDLKLAEEALSTVSQKLIEAQEQERSRVARELHDDINQRLALLAISLEGLKQSLPASAAELARPIGEASKEVREVEKDVQALSHRLHSPKLELLGLESAARAFCREFSDSQKVKVDFHSENVPKKLTPAISLSLFRVLQEALQNAARHSRLPHFDVWLRGGTNQIELTVQDSGIGFEPEEAIKGRGLGLTSMKERLRLIDGYLSIDSEMGRGTTIRARVPLGA